MPLSSQTLHDSILSALNTIQQSVSNSQDSTDQFATLLSVAIEDEINRVVGRLADAATQATTSAAPNDGGRSYGAALGTYIRGIQ